MQTPNQVQVNNEHVPVVYVKDGEVFANSRDVAAFFGKNHKDVLRAIRNLIEADADLGRRNFAPFKINDLTGETTSHYEMDRDGFTFLAMGFTGARALKWKKRFIEAFNAMEAELRRVSEADAPIDLNDPKALRGLLLNYSEKAEQLQQQVSELLPSQDALNRISRSEDLFGVRVSAKILQMKEKKFTAWIQQIGWAYRQPGTRALLCYADKQKAGLVLNKCSPYTKPDGTEGLRETLKLTPKGLIRLGKMLNIDVTDGDLFRQPSEGS